MAMKLAAMAMMSGLLRQGNAATLAACHAVSSVGAGAAIEPAAVSEAVVPSVRVAVASEEAASQTPLVMMTGWSAAAVVQPVVSREGAGEIIASGLPIFRSAAAPMSDAGTSELSSWRVTGQSPLALAARRSFSALAVSAVAASAASAAGPGMLRPMLVVPAGGSSMASGAGWSLGWAWAPNSVA